MNSATPAAVQTWSRSTGLGSLDAARGTSHLDFGGVRLEGEVEVTGRPWNPAAWVAASAAGSAWTGGSLGGNGWEGGAWLGQDWYVTSVSGVATDDLDGLTWNGLTWNSRTWSGLTWNGLTWNGLTWNGLTWNGLTWNGLTWNGLTWAGADWS
jgi:serine protease AprX